MGTKHWTPDDIAYAGAALGVVPLRAIATHLGRSPRAIEQYLCKERRVSALRHASTRGMTTPDVARALGVHRPSVARWIASGRLMATETWLHSRQIYLVAPADLRRFILSGALVGRTFNASAEWRGVINRAEINWRLRFVSAAQLEALLHITAAHFSASGHMRAQGFPTPTTQPTSTTALYFERSVVRAWMNEHPQYWTTEARRQL